MWSGAQNASSADGPLGRLELSLKIIPRLSPISQATLQTFKRQIIPLQSVNKDEQAACSARITVRRLWVSWIAARALNTTQKASSG